MCCTQNCFSWHMNHENHKPFIDVFSKSVKNIIGNCVYYFSMIPSSKLFVVFMTLFRVTWKAKKIGKYHGEFQNTNGHPELDVYIAATFAIVISSSEKKIKFLK